VPMALMLLVSHKGLKLGRMFDLGILTNLGIISKSEG